MPLDVGIFNDEYRFQKTLHIDQRLHGALFRKLVTIEDYPSLGKASDESEDITFTPADVPALKADIKKLEGVLKKTPMSDEVKGKCKEFLAGLKEMCAIALKEKRNVEFIAGE